MIAIVDSGPLNAAVNADDADHGRSLQALERPDLQLVLPALVVAQVTYLVGLIDRRHFGAVRPRHCEAFRLLPA